MGLVEGLAGDIGETGESGEIGEMVDIAKSRYLAKHGMHVELSDHVKWKGKPSSVSQRRWSSRTKKAS